MSSLATRFLIALSLGLIVAGFSPPATTARPRTELPAANGREREGWTYNPLDVDDLSPVDTLFRRGLPSFLIRVLNEEKWENAVEEYMRKDGCDRATAQRNMDKYFNDPNGWVIAKQRERDLGEDFGDINAPTGVQKRPVFSAIWATFCFWLFFIFFPTRITELGGFKPVLADGGYCSIAVRDEVTGKLVCPKSSKEGFDQYVKGKEF